MLLAVKNQKESASLEALSHYKGLINSFFIRQELLQDYYPQPLIKTYGFYDVIR
jgi:hypothetical protein